MWRIGGRKVEVR